MVQSGSVNSSSLFFYFQMEGRAENPAALLISHVSKVGFAVRPVSLNLEVLFPILFLKGWGEPYQKEEMLSLQGRVKCNLVAFAQLFVVVARKKFQFPTLSPFERCFPVCCLEGNTARMGSNHSKRSRASCMLCASECWHVPDESSWHLLLEHGQQCTLCKVQRGRHADQWLSVWCFL